MSYFFATNLERVGKKNSKKRAPDIGCFVRGRGRLPQLLPQPEAKSRKGRREPELSVTRPVAQLSDKSRVNSSSYRNEALASHGGSQVLNVAPQTERNPGHSGAMAGASKAADAVDATGSRQSFSFQLALWPFLTRNGLKRAVYARHSARQSPQRSLITARTTARA